MTTVSVKNLEKGLRPSKRMKRNAGYLTTCVGVVGRDKTLQAMDEITRLATTEIADGFPYPQVFVLNRVIVVCGLTKIYEWVSGALVEKIEVTAGNTWRYVDGFEFIWLTNNEASVIRDPKDFSYSISSTLPVGNAIWNFNGQVMVGGF
ncbi:MAG: hypothetical protein KAJ18_11690 [Candidatus Omnitrophica bacterium]|nr:hypothetical protein [Candidatus Omnitrophota bacterium]